MLCGGLCVLAACGVIRYCWGTAAAEAQVSAEPARPDSAPTAASRRFLPAPAAPKHGLGDSRPRADSRRGGLDQRPLDQPR